MVKSLINTAWLKTYDLTWILSLWISWRRRFPFDVKEATWPPGKFATTNPSLDSATLIGPPVSPWGESNDLRRSPNVVCTKIGPPALAVDPDITSPSSADITTQQTGWSWPVRTARGVGWFPPHLILLPPPQYFVNEHSNATVKQCNLRIQMQYSNPKQYCILISLNRSQLHNGRILFELFWPCHMRKLWKFDTIRILLFGLQTLLIISLKY